jgi:DNA-binding GntR family transcriptional regulator
VTDIEIKRICIRDRVRDALVARILDGTYPAGMQLKELILAREFDVSQSPIREALRELEASGLVASERYRGTRVLGMDLRDMRESYELRMILEVRAVEVGLPYSREVLVELTRCVKSMGDAFERDDLDVFVKEALRMHRQLVLACGNRTFLAQWESLHWEVRGRVAMQRVAGRREAVKPFLVAHRSLLARLRRGDVEGAIRQLRAMFERTARLFRAD